MKTALHWLSSAAPVFLFGCVDMSGRPDEDEAAPQKMIDPGSGPYDCSEDDETKFDLLLLDDFENGSASGTWYANNELCVITSSITRIKSFYSG